MSVRLNRLQQSGTVTRVIIHSLEGSLYQVSVEIDGAEHIVTDSGGQLLRTNSLTDMKERLQSIPHKHMVMRHESAYDEMVCQPSGGINRLEIQLH